MARARGAIVAWALAAALCTHAEDSAIYLFGSTPDGLRSEWLGWYSVYADLSEDARDHLADVSCAGGALVYGRAPLYSAHFRHGARARDRRSFTRRVRRAAANCTVLKRPP